MDNLDFLDAPQGANAETQPVETTEPQAEPVAEGEQEPTSEKTSPPRGPDGKFRKKEEAEPVMVPLAALHETRDELKALKQQLASFTQPQQTQPAAIPDMFEDPQGYTAFLQSQLASVTLNDRLNLSEEMVRQSAGEEVVNAAQEWGRQMLDSNPAFAQQFYAQRNPYGFLVREYQRQTTLQKLGDDPKDIETFLAWKAAQGHVQQQPAQANLQTQSTPPRSIAGAPSAGGMQHVATGPTVAFDNVFRK